MELSEWIHTAHAPIILLNASDEAQRICRKNGGLSVDQLLNAFGVFPRADTPVRTINGHITLPELRLRFISASKFKTSSSEEAAVKLNHVVATSASSLMARSVLPLDLAPVTTEDDVAPFLRSIGGDPMPWYSAFKHEVMESFQCDDTSMMYHPHALLLVVSSTEADPRGTFHQLGAPANLPSVFHDGLYDTNVPKYYLVLHDAVETQHTSIDAGAIYRNLNLPPNSGGVVRINSLSAPVANDVWSHHPYVRGLRPSEEEQPLPYGCFLSDDDRLALRTMVWEFGVKFVLPAMEAKLLSLNETVAAVRKGVRNALKAWWRKPKETSGTLNRVYLYRFDSIESNMRLLADIAFVIRDYDLAYNMYKLVRDDYKNDKALLHCAHASESIALCLYMMKGSPADIHHALDTTAAIYARLQVASPTLSLVRHAARTAILSSEIFSHMLSEHMDAASAALIRGSSATDPKLSGLGICSAVFLERAAYCDLQARNPKFRKYGFRMVMAGHVYSLLGYEPHAARCYSCARAVYANSRWHHVDDHITGTLAKQLVGLALPQQAIALLLTRIGSGRHAKGQQLTLLAEFYDLVSEYLQDHSAVGISNFHVMESGGQSAKVLLIKALVIPAIHDPSVVVFAPANALALDDVAASQPGRDKLDWKQQLEYLLMKEERIEHVATTSAQSSWLDLSVSSAAALQLPLLLRGGKKHKHATDPSPVYMVGEAVYVEFTVKNPLAVEVVLKQLHLFGSVQGSSNSSSSCSTSIDFPVSQDEMGTAVVTVDRQDIALPPHAEAVVRLSVVPHDVGVVRIQGVRWALNAHVHGEHTFDLPGMLLQDSLESRATRARAPNTTLVCDIQPAMPWLGVSFTRDGNPLPTPLTCLEGEVLTLDLHVANKGSYALSHLTLVCSSWLYVVEGAAAGGDDDDAVVTSRVVGASGHVTTLPTLTLNPNESKSFKVHCSSRTLGPQQVRFLFRYANANNSTRRVVPVEFEIEVLKGLTVSHAIHPSYNDITEYVLALSIHNGRKDSTKEPVPSMTIQSVTSWSSSWKIQPFQNASDVPSSLVPPRPASVLQWQESSTLYFRVSRRVDGDVANTVRLGGEVSPVLFPCAEFLCLDHAASRITALKQSKALATGGSTSSQSHALRSIQSVRRENQGHLHPPTKNHGEIADSGRVKPTSREALLVSPEV
ncbi:hypothetical protein DYB34_002027 [Aphanomyces astaci]|uniref:TPPC8 first Ig-like domain-containing protein n=1 Tax=Aphanomyces astaci TaxID=112090 RepID=A0A3R6VY06_APHAT|nr:hypothetical protein DYB34_002027 [Aphanomyces astaci]